MSEPSVVEVLTRIDAQLVRIATVLEQMVATDQEPAPEASPVCLHPDEERVSYGVTKGVADWQCRACGFRTVPQEAATHV